MVTHPRGHKTHPNLPAIVRRAFDQHGQALRNLANVTAPSYDCRTLGIVGPVKDQGQCGDCWLFSGTGIAESAQFQAGIAKNDGTFLLSEQYGLDCQQNGGCNGDDAPTVMGWATVGGIPSTAQYGPYQGGVNSCKDTSQMQMYKVAEYGFCTNNNGGVANVQDIKNCMAAYGPISCAVASDGFDGYTGGVFLGTGSTAVDHDIQLVGWQDDPAISGGGYWWLKNSWDTTWGENGYMRIAYNVNQVGTEAMWCSATPTPPPSGSGPVSLPGPGGRSETGWSGVVTYKSGIVTAITPSSSRGSNPSFFLGVLKALCADPALIATLPLEEQQIAAFLCGLVAQNKPCGGCK